MVKTIQTHVGCMELSTGWVLLKRSSQLWYIVTYNILKEYSLTSCRNSFNLAYTLHEGVRLRFSVLYSFSRAFDFPLSALPLSFTFRPLPTAWLNLTSHGGLQLVSVKRACLWLSGQTGLEQEKSWSAHFLSGHQTWPPLFSLTVRPRDNSVNNRWGSWSVFGFVFFRKFRTSCSWAGQRGSCILGLPADIK